VISPRDGEGSPGRGQERVQNQLNHVLAELLWPKQRERRVGIRHRPSLRGKGRELAPAVGGAEGEADSLQRGEAGLLGS